MNVTSKQMMATAQTLAQTYDLNRSQILAEMEARIRTGSRTKLTRAEREMLIAILVDKLVEMAQRGDDTRTAIAHLGCGNEADGMLLSISEMPTTQGFQVRLHFIVQRFFSGRFFSISAFS